MDKIEWVSCTLNTKTQSKTVYTAGGDIFIYFWMSDTWSLLDKRGMIILIS